MALLPRLQTLKNYILLKDMRMKKILGTLGLISLVGVTMANAALTAPTISTTDFETIAGAVLRVTGVFFGLRKAIGLLY